MKGNVIRMLLFVGSVAPLVSHAQIFICKDAAGRTISSDHPVPECANRAIREIGMNGVLKREIPAPLTAEQKRLRQEEEARQKAQAAAREEQRKSDRALVARYQNEADIESARQHSLEIARDQIRREELAMADTGKQLKQAQAEADGYSKKHAKIPGDLERRIEDGQHSLDESKKLIEERQEEIRQINAKFDETVKRFREINGQPASGNS